MAEERSMNGEANRQDGEGLFDSDQLEDSGKSTELNRNIRELESRNQELARDNDEISRNIDSLTAEIEELRGAESKARRKMGEMEREIDKSDEERKVLEAIAAKASEFETEVTRLQHELITGRTEGGEAAAEAKKLRSEILLKGDGNEELEKEVADLRTVKEDNEKRMKELERKLGALEMKELEERNKKVRAEEEMRERIENKEKEMVDLKEKIKCLELDVAKAELQKWKTEKITVEDALRESEKKVMAMESENVELKRQMDDAEKMISGLKNMVEPANGIELKTWSQTVTAGSGGAVAAVAVAVAVAGAAVVCYIYHSKRV